MSAEWRVLLTVLVLAGQALAGALMPSAPAVALTILGVPLVICHAAGGGVTHPDAPVPHHHGHDCALCPACVAAVPIALAIATPTMPWVEVIVATPYAPKPDATGPPAREGKIPPPRGPPVQA